MDDDRDTESMPGGSLAGLSVPARDEPAHPFGLGEDARYREVEVVGEGGLGTVLRAHDRFLGRDVALKRIGPRARAGTPAAVHDRFLREARITARLDHPGIVPVHDAGVTEDGRLFYTMRLIRGRSLAELAARTTGLPDRLRLLGSITAACHAVGYAHRQRVVHRDLKPANIMVGDLGETQVVDWGLAERLEEVERRSGFAGTLPYASPEVVRGEAASIASDVWALGVVLHEVITGAHRFALTAGELEATLSAEHVAAATWPADCPRELVAIGDRAMASDPAARYPDAQALAEDLEAFRDGRRVAAHRYSALEILRRFVVAWRWPLAALATLVIGTIGALALTNYRTERERARAVAAEAATRDQLVRTEAALRDSFAAEAVAALGSGSYARAERLAIAALGYGEHADARGVVAATRAAPRPRAGRRVAVPGCPQVIALSVDALACLHRDRVVVYGVAPLRERWTLALPVAGVASLEHWLVAWTPTGEVVVLDAATGAEHARDRSLERVSEVVVAAGGERLVLRDARTVIAIGEDGAPAVSQGSCGGSEIAAAATTARDAFLVCHDGRLGEVTAAGWQSLGTTAFGVTLPRASALAISDSGVDLAIGNTAGDLELRDLRGCFSSGCQLPKPRLLARALSSRVRTLTAFGSDVIAVSDRGDAVHVAGYVLGPLTHLPIPSDQAATVLEGGDVLAGGDAWRQWSIDMNAAPFAFVHERGLATVAVRPEAGVAAAIDDRGAVIVWDLRTGGARTLLAGTTARALALSPDGRSVLLDEGTTTSTLAVLDGRRLGQGPANPARGAAGGELAVTSSADASVVARAWPHRVVVERGGTDAWEIESRDAEVTSLAVDAAGQTIAIGTSHGTLEVWDRNRRAMVARIPAHTQRTTWIGFADDWLWSASSDGVLRRWQLAAVSAAVAQLAREAAATWGE